MDVIGCFLIDQLVVGEFEDLVDLFLGIQLHQLSYVEVEDSEYTPWLLIFMAKKLIVLVIGVASITSCIRRPSHC